MAPVSVSVSANHQLHPRQDLGTFRQENRICVLISPRGVLKCAKVWYPCCTQCCWLPTQVSSPTRHSDVQILAESLGFQQFATALSLFLRTVPGGRKATCSEMPGGPRLIPGASAVICWLTDIRYQRSSEMLFTTQKVLRNQPEAGPQLSPIFDQLLSLPWPAFPHLLIGVTQGNNFSRSPALLLDNPVWGTYLNNFVFNLELLK